VPGKNIRPLLGKPLIVHSIEQAQAAGIFDQIAVSSDDASILDVARAAGVDHVIERPAEMATDQAAKLPAIRHCVEAVESAVGTRFDIVTDLQPTSPLRLPLDIVGAVALLEEEGADNVITGSPAKCSPYFNLVEERADGSVGLSKPTDPPIIRRQDAPRTFDMNGSVYVWRRSVLMQCPGLFLSGTRLYEMPEERSADIDTELDFQFVDFLASRASSL
jgi:CMP-N,N'-diacetyllegionaminic acid synthase